MDYVDLKDLIASYIGLERDALHIHAAVSMYLVAVFLFRQSRRSPLPWLLVLAFELANEALDLGFLLREAQPVRLTESAKDLWNTMLWPTVLLFICRYTKLFQHPLT